MNKIWILYFFASLSFQAKAQTKVPSADGRSINCISTSDKDKMRVQYTFKIDGVDRTMGEFTNINFDDIKNAFLKSENHSSYIKVSSSKELTFRYVDPGKDDDGVIDTQSHYNVIELYLNWDSEHDLLNRMQIAFTKLISFNPPKETF
jgi:hypothetical protein